tara:strand:- start:103 stop:498 length:396 start_codon:yes stop_codon:yes gene_type:complete
MDNIYCKHYLLPNKILLQDPEFKNFFINIENSYFFNNDHICIHIKDSIHYKVLSKELPFELYDKYITITNQPEHSLEKYKNLINNFNINKMLPIKLYKENNHIFTSDGCHRLAILYFNSVPINEKHLDFTC